MDFTITFSEELEGFRADVANWLDEHGRDLLRTSDPDDVAGAEWNSRLGFRRKFGARGWLYPTLPVEYGGGGLTSDHAMILAQEMDKRQLPNMVGVARMAATCILVWGTEEQKQRLAAPLIRGEATGWQLLTEPQGGSDLASAKTRAVRDGDDYVVNGNKIFVGDPHPVDYFWTLVNTDPLGARHRNLTYLMIPANLPGVSIYPLDLLSGSKNSVFFEDVRVPANCRIGEENEGWRVANSNMEIEHGGEGSASTDRPLDALLQTLRDLQAEDPTLLEDPEVREVFARAYIDKQVERVLGLRNFWMRHNRIPMTYEGPQYNHWKKGHPHQFSKATQDLLGYFALTRDPAYMLPGGHIEQQQRGAFPADHAGGSFNIQGVVLSRRLGVGRTAREEAGSINV